MASGGLCGLSRRRGPLSWWQLLLLLLLQLSVLLKDQPGTAEELSLCQRVREHTGGGGELEVGLPPTLAGAASLPSRCVFSWRDKPVPPQHSPLLKPVPARCRGGGAQRD